jgi:hypothetical protein
MGDEMNQVAQTIIDQLGGAGKLTAMTGAHSFLAMESGVQFKFKGSKQANCIIVKLNPSDTYTVEFWRTGRTAKHVLGITSAYAEDLKPLFEQTTGLYLSL